ncbi:MAG: toprim domain-containing protein [Opitutaceae bacterium]
MSRSLARSGPSTAAPSTTAASTTGILFLPGPQRGIFNPAALRSPEIILTEGIIDALTFWGAGFRNVTTGYSAKALPEELLAAVVAAKVRRVLIAFDRDASGDTGAVTAAAQLAAYGVECVRVLFPHGLDANAYALQVTPPREIPRRAPSLGAADR